MDVRPISVIWLDDIHIDRKIGLLQKKLPPLLRILIFHSIEPPGYPTLLVTASWISTLKNMLNSLDILSYKDVYTLDIVFFT